MRSKKLKLGLLGLAFLAVAGSIAPSSANAEEVGRQPVYYMLPQYELTRPFSEGLATVVKNGEMMVIDKNGKKALDPSVSGYDVSIIQTFHQGVAVATACFIMGCDPFLIDNEGRKVAEPSWEITPFWPDKGIFTYVTDVIPGDSGDYYIYRLVDKNGKFLDGVKFHTYRVLSNGLYELAMLRLEGEKRNIRFGLMDGNGKLLAPTEYAAISTFHNGIAVVEKDGKYGYLNEQGVEILPPIYDRAYDFEHGIGVFVKSNGDSDDYGAVSASGKIVLEPMYRRIQVEEKGFLFVEDHAGGQLLYNASGQRLFSASTGFFQGYGDGLILYIDKDAIYLDENGRETLRFKFPPGPFPDVFHDGVAMIGKSFVGKDGRPIDELQSIQALIGTKYDYISPFYGDLALVGKTGLYGYIDRSGKEVYPPTLRPTYLPSEFDELGVVSVYDGNYNTIILSRTGLVYDDYEPRSSEGMTPIMKGGLWGFVNLEGREAVKPAYDEVHGFEGGRALVSKNGKLGYIDLQGKEIIKPIYDDIQPYSEDLARVKRDGYYGFVDRNGNEVLSPQFQDAGSFSEGLANVRIDDRWGYIIHPLNGTGIKPLGTAEQPDEWAEAGVRTAIELGLVSPVFQAGYSADMTREQFSMMIVRLIETRYKQSIEEVLTGRKFAFDGGWESTGFVDVYTSDRYNGVRRAIMAAHVMGIVSGKGKDKDGSPYFDPKGAITREEAAVMLSNAASFMGMSMGAGKSEFRDYDNVSSWARSSVDWVSAYGIMSGVGDGQFAPKQPYSQQQSILTMLRLYQAVMADDQ